MGRKSFFILIAVSIITIVLFGLLTANQLFRIFAFLHFSYYLTFLGFFIWLAFVLKDSDLRRERIIAWLKNNAAGIAVSLVLVMIFISSAIPQFRIQPDEYQLVGISRFMLSDKVPFITTAGYWYRGAYHNLDGLFAQKPNLFPFLMSLVHTVAGYSPRNGFALNAVLTFLLFINIYLLIKRLFGERLALASIVMCASYPLLALCATSSGFEVLNLLFMVLALRYFHDYMTDPQPVRLNKLVFTLVLMAQCRSESIGIALLFMAVVFLKEIGGGFKNITRATAAFPVFCLPVIWQIPFSMQIQYSAKAWLAAPKVTSSNLLNFIYVFFFPVHNQPVNFIGSYLALFGIIYLCVSYVRGTKIILPGKGPVLWVCLSIFAYYVILYVFLFKHSINQVPSFRLLLVFIPFFAFLAAYFLDLVLKKRGLQWCLAPVLIGMFFFFNPLAVDTLKSYSTDEYVLKNYADKDNVLIISYRVYKYVIRNFGACNIEYANKNKESILKNMRAHLYGEVIVVQDIDYNTGEPIERDALDKDFRLRTVYEIKNNFSCFTRYSVCEQPQ